MSANAHVYVLRTVVQHVQESLTQDAHPLTLMFIHMSANMHVGMCVDMCVHMSTHVSTHVSVYAFIPMMQAAFAQDGLNETGLASTEKVSPRAHTLTHMHAHVAQKQVHFDDKPGSALKPSARVLPVSAYLHHGGVSRLGQPALL